MQLGVFLGGVVEHLQFAHPNVCRVTTPGITDRKAVVTARRQLEFKTRREIGQLLIEINGASLPFPTLNRPVGDDVIVGRAAPPFQVFAIEHRLESVIPLGCQNLATLAAADLADEHVSPANLASVRLQLDRAGARQRPLAVEIIFQPGVIHNMFAVQPNRDALTNHYDTETIPLTERFVRQY